MATESRGIPIRAKPMDRSMYAKRSQPNGSWASWAMESIMDRIMEYGMLVGTRFLISVFIRCNTRSEIY